MSSRLRTPVDAVPTLDAMQIGDLGAVAAIEAGSYSHPWTSGNFVDSLAAHYWCRVLRAPDGAVAAYAVAQPGVDELHLLNVTVAAAWRRQGLARRLLDALVDHAHVVAAPRIWLEVRPSNLRAIDIYKRYGFARIAVRRAYYPLNEREREDALILCLDRDDRRPPGDPDDALD